MKKHMKSPKTSFYFALLTVAPLRSAIQKFKDKGGLEQLEVSLGL